jgi:hypothetical protein
MKCLCNIDQRPKGLGRGKTIAFANDRRRAITHLPGEAPDKACFAGAGLAAEKDDLALALLRVGKTLMKQCEVLVTFQKFHIDTI